LPWPWGRPQPPRRTFKSRCVTLSPPSPFLIQI
jgi:hypothetical protein